MLKKYNNKRNLIKCIIKRKKKKKKNCVDMYVRTLVYIGY